MKCIICRKRFVVSIHGFNTICPDCVSKLPNYQGMEKSVSVQPPASEEEPYKAEVRQLVCKLDDGHWPSMVLESIEESILRIVRAAALRSRLSEPKEDKP